jgi:ketosteroid isomerase-like protein
MAERSSELVRRVYQAFNDAAPGALRDLLSADCVMDWSRSIGPLRGTYRGAGGAAEWMAAITDAFEDFRLEPAEYLVSGDLVVVPTRVIGTGRGSGVEIAAGGTTVWQLRDGRVVAFTLYQDHGEALAAAGLG